MLNTSKIHGKIRVKIERSMTERRLKISYENGHTREADRNSNLVYRPIGQFRPIRISI